MESLDFKSFLSSIEPFSSLEADDLKLCVDSLDIEYFKAEESILRRSKSPEHYYIVARGYVKEIDENDEITYYGVKDSFCAESLINNSAKNSFIAGEETIVYALKKDVFLELFYTRDSFKNYYLNSISEKFKQLIKKESDEDLAIFVSTKVKDIFLNKAIIVTQSTSIIESAKLMSENNADSIIVRYDSGYGIVTNTDLREKVLITGKSLEDNIGDIATASLITIDEDDFLFNALLLMIEHSISRVGVLQGDKIVGVLEQIDLLSSISNKAHLINLEIQRAKSIEELRWPSSDVVQIIKSLRQKGVKVRHITKLLADINYKIYQKLLELIAPKELLENSTLIVMGSEGRKEQTLRTDQDNALIIRDGFEFEDAIKIGEKFTNTLAEFGFPLCDGGIMISNPQFNKSLAEFKDDIYSYSQKPSGENVMSLSILYDASYVCGDREIFEEFRSYIVKTSRRDMAFLAHFAKASHIFETPLTMFSKFVTDKSHKNGVDIKKGAIFPIVHSIRSFSLEKGIEQTNTFERIKELNNLGYLDREFAEELIESFTFLLTLRLNTQLQSIELGREPDNYINPSSLSKFERDLLRDIFKLVDKLKKLTTHHFRLNMVS
ncbi:MAG: putative nucleotidyltransferase substrate binding domain-containing protein [Campylobacterales bacterium]